MMHSGQKGQIDQTSIPQGEGKPTEWRDVMAEADQQRRLERYEWMRRHRRAMAVNYVLLFLAVVELLLLAYRFSPWWRWRR